MASTNKIPFTVYFRTRAELARIKRAAKLAHQDASAFMVRAAIEKATHQRVVDFPARDEEPPRSIQSL